MYESFCLLLGPIVRRNRRIFRFIFVRIDRCEQKHSSEDRHDVKQIIFGSIINRRKLGTYETEKKKEKN